MAHDCYISTCCDMKRFGVVCIPVAHIPISCLHIRRMELVDVIIAYLYLHMCMPSMFYVQLLTAVYLSIMFYNQSAFHFDIIILSTGYMRSLLLIDLPINHRSSRARHTENYYFEWLYVWAEYTFFSVLLLHNHKTKRLGLGIQRWKTTAPIAFKAYELVFCDVLVCK